MFRNVKDSLNYSSPQLNDAYMSSEGFVTANVVDENLQDDIWEYQLAYKSTANITSDQVTDDFKQYLDELEVRFFNLCNYSNMRYAVPGNTSIRVIAKVFF